MKKMGRTKKKHDYRISTPQHLKIKNYSKVNRDARLKRHPGRKLKEIRRFRKFTRAKQRQKYYTEGAGAEGFFARIPRLKRVSIRDRLEARERFSHLRPVSKFKPKTERAYWEVKAKLLDAYMNQLIQETSHFAKHAREKDKSRGLTMMKKDTDIAIFTYTHRAKN